MNRADHQLLRNLGDLALTAILRQQTVSVTRRPDEERNGFPLPTKRNKIPNPDGTITQEYRPLAVLEWINEVCSGELASRLAKQRAEAKASP